MKPNFLTICFLLFAITYSVYGQKISETNFSVGINKTSSPVQQERWGEDPAPSYLTFGVGKSWYNGEPKFSIRKEIGLNLQYAYINLASGGLGAGNHYTGNIISLFANAAVLARFKVKTIAFGLGPEAEMLLIGNNHLTNSYYSVLNSTEARSGEIKITGLNRDYFNKPSFGIKASLFETNVTEKVTIGISISYLWTKSEASDFYAANYTKISFFIGFRKNKKTLEQPAEELPTAE